MFLPVVVEHYVLAFERVTFLTKKVETGVNDV
jgi:hypothetical protein